MAEIRVTDEDLKNTFDLFDTDGTGEIDEAELTFVLKSIGFQKVTRSDLAEIMGENTSLNFEQFKEMIRKRQSEAGSIQEIKAAFKLFDPDGSGLMSLVNLQKVSEIVEGKPASEGFLKEVIASADLNKDGCLDFEEFRLAVTKYDDKSPLEQMRAERRSANPRPRGPPPTKWPSPLGEDDETFC
eukprot:TRINITY_DN4904_c2_g1_i1.p1 TRINITY_DN4904_c2_g1~~TRINITY_DN4904_c2_g1_i1.p1  ORF type:complete len:205 (+),score=61.70 TRINITY_DN4904_c2_g1_i1:61-615(+)